MKKVLAPLLSLFISASTFSAETELDVHKLNSLLVSQIGSFSEGQEPLLVPGASIDRMQSSGSVGLITQTQPTRMILVTSAEKICELVGFANVLNAVDVTVAELLASYISTSNHEGRCAGSILREENGAWHVLLNGNGLSSMSSEGLWLSESSTVPVRELRQNPPNSKVISMLFALDPRPTTVLNFGESRLAFEYEENPYVAVGIGNMGWMALQICGPESVELDLSLIHI